MVSLVEPINAQAKIVSNLGRTWPIIDPSKKRGRLRRWQDSSAAVEEQPSKRQKVKKPSGIEAFDDVSFTDKTAILPLPRVPGVSEETLQGMVRSGKYERCHQCQGCILGKGRPCLSLAAIRRWDEGLGGVSPANAQDVTDRVMRGERGVRCGMCRTCRQPRSNKLACVTALAAARGELPPRLAKWISNDALSAQQALLHNLLKEYGDGDADSNGDGDSDGDGDGDDDNISCSEEDSEEGGGVRQCAPDKYNEKFQNGEQWVCRSLIESNNSGSRFRSCGHLNTGAETVCSLCKCLRWELELESRVVAALNAGQGLEALLLYPLEELSSSLASRLSAEAGTFLEPLPGMAPDRWGVDGERTLLEDVNDVLQRLRERYLRQHEKESIDGAAFKKDKKARLLRHSFLGKASKQVEYALLRVVEEQSFLISEDSRLSSFTLPLHTVTALREPNASRSCPQKEDGNMTVYDVLAGELNAPGNDELSEAEAEAEALEGGGGGGGGLSGGEEPDDQEHEQRIVSNFEMFCDEIGTCFGVDLLDESKADSNILNIVHNFCKRLFFACDLQFWTAERILSLKHAITQDSEVLDNLIAASAVANLGQGPPGLLSRTVEAVINGVREGLQSNSPGTQNAEASQPHGPVPLTQQSQMEGGVPPRGVLRRNSLTADAGAGQEPNAPAPTLPIRFSTNTRVRNENVAIQDTSNVSVQSNRIIRIAMSLFHVLCSLHHAVLDVVALQEAESRCPKTFVHAQRRILYE